MKHLEVNEQQGLLVFQKPVLSARDIEQLLEAGPTSREQTDDGELWTYVWEKQYPNGVREEQNFDIHAILVMRKNKLREIRLPERFLTLRSKERTSSQAVGRYNRKLWI
jgi:hypothetical protein